jgi:hypothetical protein
MAAAAVGALIAGLGVYAVGARANQDPFAEMPALVQTVDGRFIQVPNAKAVGYAPMGYASALQPAAQPVVLGQPAAQQVVYRQPAPTRTVYRTAQPVQQRVVVEDAQPRRSWAKTAMVIGGSSAAGAGVGGMMGGKKGALIGAALGGGAASIFEATRR